MEVRYPYESVYIFENTKAQLVKIGMTTDSIANRLNDINDKWLNRQVTCQICGGRYVNIKGYVPPHVVSGIKCPGGLKLPLEENVSIAETYLENMMSQRDKLSGIEKGSITRKIITLEERIEKYLNYQKVGLWNFSVAFITKQAELVELHTHKFLEECRVKEAPIGEVFYCTVIEASKSVEKALSQLGLLQSAKKQTQL